jgi:hypothetical protein
MRLMMRMHWKLGRRKFCARRLAEIDTGTAKLIDRDEFQRQMQARIGG